MIIEHCRYILLGKFVLCVCYQQAGLAHHAIADDGYFKRAQAFRHCAKPTGNCKETGVEASICVFLNARIRVYVCMYACVTYLSAALHHLVAYAEAATCVVYLATPTSHCNRKSVSLCACVCVGLYMYV